MTLIALRALSAGCPSEDEKWTNTAIPPVRAQPNAKALFKEGDPAEPTDEEADLVDDALLGDALEGLPATRGAEGSVDGTQPASVNLTNREPDVPRTGLLQTTPKDVLADVFARGRRDEAPRGEHVAACVEQLRSADLELMALRLTIVSFQRALEDQRASSRLDTKILARLRSDLTVVAGQAPALTRWTTPLVDGCQDARDLRAALGFLERAHALWELARDPTGSVRRERRPKSVSPR